jgi:Filamentous haemagglutinin family outer membrane protein
LAAGDRTAVSAGRNLLAGLQGLVELGGPGTLDIRAGRDLDLGASAGIATIGNRKGATLPAAGASVRVAAATEGTLDLAVLDARRREDPSIDAALLSWLREQLQQPALAADAAWATFQGLPAAAQAAFGRRLLADAFRRSVLDAPAPSREALREQLRTSFDIRKADLLRAGDAALAAGRTLTLPGREPLEGAELRGYLDGIRALAFDGIELEATLDARLASLQSIREAWQAEQAAGRDTPADLERFRERVLPLEAVSAASAATNFGRLSLPLRLALFDQGFAAAELVGAGSFVAQPLWPGAPLLRYAGRLDMTQSAVITERGGGIELINPGGGINVGLKEAGSGSGPKGVIARGGGDIFGYARDDFQVNVQRVFVVGRGDLRIWSSSGDIDSGRGANTAVAAPPLAPRRSADGVVFEVPATTTGSGLGIVPDSLGRADGTIGLYPAFGEILALDAFIKAPRIELGATVRGADNLGGSVTGVAAAVLPPPPAAAVGTPAATSEQRGGAPEPSGTAQGVARQSLLTVELLGTGAAVPCEGLSGPPLAECRRRLAAEPPRAQP